MKTTIDIAAPLFLQLRHLANERSSTLQDVVETALRRFLDENREVEREGFQLRDASVDGNGVQQGIRDGNWDQIRSLVYEGCGG